MPIVEERIKIEGFSGKAASTAKDWNDVPILNEYADMTNIDMEWNQVAVDGLAEKRNLTLASEDLPDLFYGAYIPNSDLYKYGKQGVFIPLNDLIDDYAPNIKAYLNKISDVEYGIKFSTVYYYSIHV